MQKKIKNKETGEIFASITLGAESVHVKDSTIRAALYNSNRTAGGYHWEYIEGDV